MSRITLPALFATALWATAFAPTQAQVKPKETKATPTLVKAKEETTVKPKLTSPNPVVGSVNGKPIYWNQVIARLQADQPDALQQSVSQVMGEEVATTLFGKRPKEQVTYTKTQVLQVLREKPTRPISDTLQQMLTAEAFEQELAKQDKKFTDADVDMYMNGLLQQARENGVIQPPTMTDDDFLKSRGLTRAKLRGRLRTQAEGLWLVQKDMEKTAGHKIGDGDFVQARHILIRVDDANPNLKPEDKKKLDEDAKKKIEGIAADIKSGKIKFEDAAKQNSDDGSKEQGGDLGVFMRGMMVKEFENAAFTLKPGEVSEPIRSQYGYHLIRVDRAGKDITDKERNKALDGQKQRKYNDYSQVLMSRYKVTNSLKQPTPPGGMGMMPNGGGPSIRPGGGNVRPTLRPVPRPTVTPGGGGASPTVRPVPPPTTNPTPNPPTPPPSKN